MQKINSLDELKTLCSNNPAECFILLNFGLRSSKDIEYDESSDAWNILNHIDDTEQVVSTKELSEKTNIIEALEKGALYKY